MDDIKERPKARRGYFGLPIVLWDAVGVLFFVAVALSGAYWLIPVLVVYIAYRVAKKLVTGTAYPPKEPGQHRSFVRTKR